MSKRNFWRPGERARLASLCGITPQQLSDILHRRRVVGKFLALCLSSRLSMYFRKRARVSTMAFLFNKETKHPAFFGAPMTTKAKKR